MFKTLVYSTDPAILEMLTEDAVAKSGKTPTRHPEFWDVEGKVYVLSYESYKGGDPGVNLGYTHLIVVSDSKPPKKELRGFDEILKRESPAPWDEKGWYNLTLDLSHAFGPTLKLDRQSCNELARTHSTREITNVIRKLEASGLTPTLELVLEAINVSLGDYDGKIQKMLKGEFFCVSEAQLPSFLGYSSKRIESYLTTRVDKGCFSGNPYQIKYLVSESKVASTDRLLRINRYLKSIQSGVSRVGYPKPQKFILGLLDTLETVR